MPAQFPQRSASAAMSRNHRGKRSKLSTEQRNQAKAIRYYIKIFAEFRDIEKELTNTLTMEDNQFLLNDIFGVVDSAVIPCYGFDGCVLRDPKGLGAWQNRQIISYDYSVSWYEPDAEPLT